jgi:hypothetical protein
VTGNRKSSIMVKYQKLHSRRGLASALIILILVLLIFFAVLSVVASAADLRLAKKRAVWNQQYYLADSAAVAFYADLDQYCAGQPLTFFMPDSLAKSLDGWLFLREDVQTYQVIDQDGSLRLQILVVEPAAALSGDSAASADAKQRQGIEMTLLIKTEPTSQSTAGRLSIISWTQWQLPFEYDQGNGGVWKG